MAGMLPGVECARRRRFHQSSGCSDMGASAFNGSTRRPTFCLYTSTHESLLSSTSSMQRSKLHQGHHDERLGEVAREAKERLDERLRAQRKSDPKRGSNCQESRLTVGEGTCVVVRDLQTEVFGSKKSSGGGNYSKRVGWGKWRWRASEQEECAICLECFKAGENLVHLPCAHRFHSRCLVPWLECSSHCPCCRVAVFN